MPAARLPHRIGNQLSKNHQLSLATQKPAAPSAKTLTHGQLVATLRRSKKPPPVAAAASQLRQLHLRGMRFAAAAFIVAHAPCVQVASFALTALFSGFWFVLWARPKLWTSTKQESVGWDPKHIWGKLGWFSGLVCAGSMAGAVAWYAQMKFNDLYYEANAPGITRQQHYALNTSAWRWLAAFLILYSAEFICLIIPKLMLLGRLTDNAARSLQAPDVSGGRLKWVKDALPRRYRIMAAAVVIISLAGVVANIVVAVFYVQYAWRSEQAAAACGTEGNDTNSSLAWNSEGNLYLAKAYITDSVQNVFEAVVLVFISTAYVILIPLSIFVFRHAERCSRDALVSIEDRHENSMVELPAVFAKEEGMKKEMKKYEAEETVNETLKHAQEQRRRFVVACAVVLTTFSARAALDFLLAYSSFNDLTVPACGLCDPCQSDRFLVQIWLIYTPQFQSIVVALSSPIPLAISLWLMMSKEQRTHLRFPGVNVHNYQTPEKKKSADACARMGVDLL
jgi:hypothetical protein